MKRFLCVCISLLIMGNTIYAISQADPECRKAMQYLEDRGEVYIRLYPDLGTNLDERVLGVSIDKVWGSEVYAYANPEGFEKFLLQNIPFETLIPPGLTGEKPKMSDYADKENRQWNTYPTYNGYVAMMDQFESDYPTLCKNVQFGTSVNGRKLLVAKISKNVNDKEKEPTFSYQATIHGDELCGYVLMLRLIDYLLSNYESDNQVKNIVDNMEVWICAAANPDGTYKGGNETVWGSVRSNANGKDLNRNYPCPDLNGEPLQKPVQVETIATMDLTKEHHFVLSADFHGGAEIVAYPWGCWSKATADEGWWDDICGNYVRTVHESSPSSYMDDNGGWMNAFDWYKVNGERLNGAVYYRQNRNGVVELSRVKKLSEGELNDHWDWNKDALLEYIEETLNGIHGTVTDTLTGDPLEAEVFIVSHDKDNSQVFSHLPHGDFYRLIEAGTYSVKFTCDKYITKTISNVVVKDGEATVLDVELWDGSTGISSNATAFNKNGISVTPYKGRVLIRSGIPAIYQNMAIYDIQGKLIRQLPVAKGQGMWDGRDNKGAPVGNGYYFVTITTNKKSISKQFIYVN